MRRESGGAGDASGSRFRLLIRVCGRRLTVGNAGFEFAGSFGEFFGHFAEKLRGAFFGFWGDFFFDVLAETGQLFVETAAEFFEFVHHEVKSEFGAGGGKRQGMVSGFSGPLSVK